MKLVLNGLILFLVFALLGGCILDDTGKIIINKSFQSRLTFFGVLHRTDSPKSIISWIKDLTKMKSGLSCPYQRMKTNVHPNFIFLL